MKQVLLILAAVSFSGCAAHYDAYKAHQDAQKEAYESYTEAYMKVRELEIAAKIEELKLWQEITKAKKEIAIQRLKNKEKKSPPLVTVTSSDASKGGFDLAVNPQALQAMMMEEITETFEFPQMGFSSIKEPRLTEPSASPGYKTGENIFKAFIPVGAIWATGKAITSIAKAADNAATTYNNSFNKAKGDQKVDNPDNSFTVDDHSDRSYHSSVDSHDDYSTHDDSITDSHDDSSAHDDSITDSHDDSSVTLTVDDHSDNSDRSSVDSHDDSSTHDDSVTDSHDDNSSFTDDNSTVDDHSVSAKIEPGKEENEEDKSY